MEQEGTIPAGPSHQGTPQPPEEVVGGEKIPDVDQEIPAPTGGESGEQEGMSSPERPPGGSPEEEKPLQEEGSVLDAPPGVSGAGVEPPRVQPPGREADFYCVKWISWKGERTPVVTQSENGPCPLLAIINILLLQWKASGVFWGWGGGVSGVVLGGLSPNLQLEDPGDGPQRSLVAPR